MKTSVTLILKKETKGTYVFATEAEDAAVSSVYINKIAFDGPPPKAITLTVEG